MTSVERAQRNSDRQNQEMAHRVVGLRDQRPASKMREDLEALIEIGPGFPIAMKWAITWSGTHTEHGNGATLEEALRAVRGMLTRTPADTGVSVVIAPQD